MVNSVGNNGQTAPLSYYELNDVKTKGEKKQEALEKLVQDQLNLILNSIDSSHHATHGGGHTAGAAPAAVGGAAK